MGILKDEVAGDVGSVPCCATCNSERVVCDAWACWNSEFGQWELETVLDQAHCHACESDTNLRWKLQSTPPNNRIRELNDLFRTEGQGNGTVLLTSGIQDKGGAFAVAAVEAVRRFDGFDDHNDPWGEHDFGSLELEEEKVFFKLDYYDKSLTMGSENPANEGMTHRILTIMLASEY